MLQPAWAGVQEEENWHVESLARYSKETQVGSAEQRAAHVAIDSPLSVPSSLASVHACRSKRAYVDAALP